MSWNVIRHPWIDRPAVTTGLQLQLARVKEKWHLVDFTTERQARRLGVDALLKDILEGRIKGKQQIRRPRCKTLDWMMNADNGYSYQNLKEMARCGEHGEICAWNLPLGRKPNEEKKKNSAIYGPLT